jgi:DNA-directed RNA polymerase subunit RPC12/RpoP
MQRGHTLEFNCQKCSKPVPFSIFQLEENPEILCDHCRKRYLFEDGALKRQLQKFEALCRQIRDSEEILSQTAVGIDVNGHQVKIPFKLLLTRLSSCLNLSIGGQSLMIHFRFEPMNDLM